MNDPTDWTFHVVTALHDEMEGGGTYPTRRSRVTVSRQHYPRWEAAAEVASCMAVIRHGGMPVQCSPVY